MTRLDRWVSKLVDKRKHDFHIVKLLLELLVGWV